MGWRLEETAAAAAERQRRQRPHAKRSPRRLLPLFSGATLGPSIMATVQEQLQPRAEEAGGATAEGGKKPSSLPERTKGALGLGAGQEAGEEGAGKRGRGLQESGAGRGAERALTAPTQPGCLRHNSQLEPPWTASGHTQEGLPQTLAWLTAPLTAPAHQRSRSPPTPPGGAEGETTARMMAGKPGAEGVPR